MRHITTLNSRQVEKELDEEEGSGEVQEESGRPAAAAAPVDNLEFLRDVEEHQVMLQQNMQRAEVLARRMHEDAAQRRRQARENTKNSLLQSAAAQVAAANAQIDALKREVAMRLDAKLRASSVEGGVDVDWDCALEHGGAAAAENVGSADAGV